MKTLIFLLSTLFLMACAPQTNGDAGGSSEAQTSEYVDLDPKAMSQQIGADVTVLDVRTPQEWEQGVIEGAVMIDYYKDDFADKVNQLDKNKPVYVYCAKGGRSSDAAEMMVEAGFSKVYNLDGGITAWNDAGLPTKSPEQ